MLQAAVRAHQPVEGGGLLPPGRGLAPERVIGQLQLVAQPRVLPVQVPALRGAAHGQPQLVRVPRLGDEVIDAPGVDRLHQAVHVGIGGQHDAHRVRGALLALSQELDPGHAGHALVGEDHRHLGLRLQTGQRLLAVARAQHAELGGEDRLQRVQHAGLVVHDQDGGLVHGVSGSVGDAGARVGRRLVPDHRALAAGSHPRPARRLIGSRTVNTAPPPAGLSAWMSPPWCFTIS